MKYLIFLVIISFHLSCQHGLTPASQRSIASIPKMGTDKVVGTSRPIGAATAPVPEFYVKHKDQQIVESGKQNNSGSLFNMEDPRNILFSDRPPVRKGTYINVDVDTNLLAKKESADDSPASAGDDSNFSEIEKAIRDSLPQLSPNESGNETLVKRFRMRVEHEFPNGDLLVRYQRRSVTENFANEINVTARVAFADLIKDRPIKTTDLGNVSWVESRDGEIFQKRSTIWEDEYTARLSGFDEAKSRIAMDLEAKKKQLEISKQRIEEQLRSMGSERTKLARERDEVAKEKSDYEQKINDLEDQTNSQKKEIDSLKNELKQIKPSEDKPGSRRDGVDGA